MALDWGDKSTLFVDGRCDELLHVKIFCAAKKSFCCGNLHGIYTSNKDESFIIAAARVLPNSSQKTQNWPHFPKCEPHCEIPTCWWAQTPFKMHTKYCLMLCNFVCTFFSTSKKLCFTYELVKNFASFRNILSSAKNSMCWAHRSLLLLINFVWSLKYRVIFRTMTKSVFLLLNSIYILFTNILIFKMRKISQ